VMSANLTLFALHRFQTDFLSQTYELEFGVIDKFENGNWPVALAATC
jgi:hypothetical protein